MDILFDEQQQVFLISTRRSSYAMAVEDGQYLCHAYYGPRIKDTNLRYLLSEDLPPYTPKRNLREKNVYLNSVPLEYPDFGMGDFREPAFSLTDADGYTGTDLTYTSYKIVDGAPKLEGLPAVFGKDTEVRTLYITLSDKKTGVQVLLSYSIFQDSDAIIRTVKVLNSGTQEVVLNRVLSASFDMPNQDFEVLSLHGAWARERNIQRLPLGYGRSNMGSWKGESSHEESPFMALVTPETTQTAGKVYAMNFIYSGNFLAQAERSHFNTVRFSMGIHPEGFRWHLAPGESFTAPEAVLVFSGEGLGHMTRTFHDLYRSHLIRSPYLHTMRPILINNWEATYFHFDEEKILSIARKASELGIEMLVMDDGWFGNRYDDNRSLGDWVVNTEKLPHGLGYLSEQIHKLGMKFGIWMEPEMVSPDSDLFRAHPDWAIQIPGRSITQWRAQYVLDFTREEVVDTVYGMIRKVLSSTKIDYVKWDMNRYLSTVGSLTLGRDRQGELYHRYVLGVYRMQDRLLSDFPDLLLENCSSGGARFDAGMLYYSPQIWCSDDTDAMERLAIQEGTALVYPVSSIGAHVSVCPNHGTGRTVSFSTRGNVALSGTFGYELDITKLSPEEQQMVREQVRTYHRFNDLIREGDYYRLSSLRENGRVDAWMFVAKDQSEALVTVVHGLVHQFEHATFLPLDGLNASRVYRSDEGDVCASGALLMGAGIRLEPPAGDFSSLLIHLQAAE